MPADPGFSSKVTILAVASYLNDDGESDNGNGEASEKQTLAPYTPVLILAIVCLLILAFALFAHKKYRLAAAVPFIVAVILAAIIAVALLPDTGPTQHEDGYPAPDFSIGGNETETVNLSDLAGRVVVLHITNIEEPICFECEHVMRSQVKELELLRVQRSDVAVVTLNLRKNPYSTEGCDIAEQNWGVNATWYWVEDFDPYPIAGKYLDYWNIEGGASNPTILLIDKEQNIVGVYHVYQMGKGEIDGVQDAEELSDKIEKVERGEWEGFEGEISQQSISFLGMFVLGIITSLSPCSVALLITMFSYIISSSGKEEENGEEDSSSSREGLIIGVAFTLGMALVFFIIGLFISFIGVFVRASPFFYLIAGILLVIFGVNNIKSIDEMIEPLRNLFKRSNKAENTEEINEKKGFMGRITNVTVVLFRHSTFLGAFFLGIFFALGWAPCAISLVFPVLIWMVSQDTSLIMGALMLFVFGLGHGIPIIPISTVSRTVRGNIGQKYISIGKWITKIFGIIVIILGFIFAARYFGYYLW
ncbi:MAG: cytochrome c biogenesis protein [Thermoplasmata archaeon]|nr:MAG: cytochrome c biogenesis protein [Thermoplasmata archaeon]